MKQLLLTTILLASITAHAQFFVLHNIPNKDGKWEQPKVSNRGIIIPCNKMWDCQVLFDYNNKQSICLNDTCFMVISDSASAIKALIKELNFYKQEAYKENERANQILKGKH